MLPSSADTSCLFRTKVHPAMETILLNEIFRVAISQGTLLQKTLRVDVCAVSRSRREECLVCSFTSGFFFGKHLFIVSPCTLMLKAAEIAQYLLQNFFSAYSCCFNTLVFSEIPDTQFYPGWMFQEVA